ncbi:MAG TPA: AzlC family ABC transporter permease [Actinomycetospora sp.]|nr:AzlC family ABC transporter permease [Actinomycetospora sp.]
MDITLRHSPAPEVRAALRDLAPVMVGLAPFALLIGVTGVRSGVGGGTGVLSSALLLGGSAQLTGLTMLAGGASPLALVAAVTLVNARFLLYAAALEPSFRHQPRWFRWVGPQFVVDPTYAMAARRDDLADPRRFRRYWLAAGVGLATVWVGLTVLGVVLAPVLPESAALDVAAPAMFLAVLVPQLRARPARAGASAAAVTAVVASPLPDGLGLLCGIAAGVLAATLADRSTS